MKTRNEIIIIIIIMLYNFQYIKCFKCTKSNIINKSILKRCVSSLDDSLDENVIKFAKVLDVDGVERNMRYLDIGNDNSLPPILILGGTAQTISTFYPHVRPISRARRLIIPELRCQGETDLLSQYATIQQHIKDLDILLKIINVYKIHLAGYSFGGRIGIAFCANYGTIVSKLSVTAVPLKRPMLGNLILKSWQDSLERNNLRDCAWSFMLNGYSNIFLEKYSDRIPSFVDIVIKNNKDPKNLLDLLINSHVSDEDPFSVMKCSQKITCPTQIIGAKHDRIAGLIAVSELAKFITETNSNVIYHEVDTGHLAPFEQPNQWRKLILDFFN